MCVHRTDEGICKKFSVDGVTSYCVDGPCKDEVLTNADRIRSMSDEELAEFINCCTSGDGTPDFCRRLPECDDDLESDTLIPFERCNQCLLYWLRHPVIQGVTYE